MADEKTQRELDVQTIIYATKKMKDTDYITLQNDNKKHTTTISTLHSQRRG